MENKEEINWFAENWDKLVSILISILALVAAWKANTKSKEAVEISKKALKIEEDRFESEKRKSLEITLTHKKVFKGPFASGKVAKHQIGRIPEALEIVITLENTGNQIIVLDSIAIIFENSPNKNRQIDAAQIAKKIDRSDPWIYEFEIEDKNYFDGEDYKITVLDKEGQTFEKKFSSNS